MTENSTLQLIPEEAPELEPITVQLGELPPNTELVGPEPDAALVEGIRQYGAIYDNIVVTEKKGSKPEKRRYDVIDGRRRIKALRALDKEWAKENEGDDQDSPWQSVPAVLVDGLEDAGYALGVTLNNTARPNPVSDLEAIEHYERAGFSDQAIARATRLTVGQVRSKKQLGKLIPQLRARFKKGQMSASAAKAAVSLSEAKQLELHEAAGEKPVKLKDVQDAKRVKREAAQSSISEAITGLPGIEDVDTETPSTEQGEVKVSGAYGKVLWEDDNLMVMANGDWQVQQLPVRDDEGNEYFALQITRGK